MIAANSDLKSRDSVLQRATRLWQPILREAFTGQLCD